MSNKFNQALINTTKLSSPARLSKKRREIIGDILELYQCRPQPKLYRHFHPQAEFVDPLCDAQNLTEVKAQFNAMPKVFPTSETKQCQVTHNGPKEIRINLVQAYTTVWLGSVIEMNSLVLIKLDDKDRVVCLEDQWYHKAGWKEEGMLTSFTNLLRRLNARALPKFITTE